MSLSCLNLKCVSPLRRCSGGDASSSAPFGPIRRISSRAPLGVGRGRRDRARERSMTGATAIDCDSNSSMIRAARCSDLETAVVNARGAARIAAGHPWVYRPDVVRGPDARRQRRRPVAGRASSTAAGKPLGVATWAARAAPGAAHGRARGPDREPATSLALVAERLSAALARRRGAGPRPRRLSRRPRRERPPAPAWSSIATPTPRSSRRRRWR